jgi:hypothetical protein
MTERDLPESLLSRLADGLDGQGPAPQLQLRRSQEMIAQAIDSHAESERQSSVRGSQEGRTLSILLAVATLVAIGLALALWLGLR